MGLRGRLKVRLTTGGGSWTAGVRGLAGGRTGAGTDEQSDLVAYKEREKGNTGK